MAEDGRAYGERSWTAPDGVTIYFRDYPGSDGPARLPVVCLHGLTRNSADFEEIAATIAASGRRVLVPDMRGRGRSEHDPVAMNYVPKTYARDVIGLFHAAGIERAIFLGTSMGGLITIAVALGRPKMVAGAILNDVGPEIAPEGLERIKAYAGKPVVTPDWTAAEAYVREINGPAFPHLKPEQWARFARRTFREGADGAPILDYDPRIREPIAAGKATVPKFIAWMMFRRLAKGRPTMVLRGALSDILSADIARRMKEKAPDLTLIEIEGVGHAPLLDEPQAERSILNFLERVD